jgi:NhaA family Na+:H+ antiporter
MAQPKSLRSMIGEFLRLDAAGGIVLAAAAAVAIVLANSPWSGAYFALLDIPLGYVHDGIGLRKPLLLWINDGLMAIFFLLIGLELKREMLAGELAEPSRIVFPTVAALGGMAVPALIYVAFNAGNPSALNGWAIPAGTDIAFALGVLKLLGDRVPPSLKVFLLTLAILDDLGAIVIIALFYTAHVWWAALAVAGGALVVLFALNRFNVVNPAAYVVVGAVLWVAELKSGVHATLAGVMLAAFVPFRTPGDAEGSLLLRMEHALIPWVAFGVLPVFAFANAGVSLEGITPAGLLNPVTLGIAVGLFAGKQLGVFASAWIAVKAGWASMPDGATWRQIYGVAVICGIGFTMSLFIGSLAFGDDAGYATAVRLGVLGGSLASGVVGYFLLRRATAPTRPSPPTPSPRRPT